MCAPGPPKMTAAAGTVPPTRMSAVLPDGGDPTVRASLKNMARLSRSAMILTNQSGGLGSPMVATLGGA